MATGSQARTLPTDVMVMSKPSGFYQQHLAHIPAMIAGMWALMELACGRGQSRQVVPLAGSGRRRSRDGSGHRGRGQVRRRPVGRRHRQYPDPDRAEGDG